MSGRVSSVVSSPARDSKVTEAMYKVTLGYGKRVSAEGDPSLLAYARVGRETARLLLAVALSVDFAVLQEERQK